jgi:hypothetical protein
MDFTSSVIRALQIRVLRLYGHIKRLEEGQLLENVLNGHYQKEDAKHIMDGHQENRLLCKLKTANSWRDKAESWRNGNFRQNKKKCFHNAA